MNDFAVLCTIYEQILRKKYMYRNIFKIAI